MKLIKAILAPKVSYFDVIVAGNMATQIAKENYEILVVSTLALWGIQFMLYLITKMPNIWTVLKQAMEVGLSEAVKEYNENQAKMKKA